jgi:hypothetical protein
LVFALVRDHNSRRVANLEGQPSAGIRPGDTLVFAIKILSASS